MKKHILFLIIILFITVVNSLSAQEYPVDYSSVNPHPRLWLHKGEEERIMNSVSSSPEMKRTYDYIIDASEHYLTTPTLQREKIGKRLLHVSREAFKRIFYLSFSYRMTGEEKYALRAEQEMVAISMFDDWNPSHFLDVGEMTMALAIGYDWLHDRLRSDSKELIKDAIIHKGFIPSKDKRYNWFLKASNNWNQVCNSGMVLGALAIFEEKPDESSFMIERALRTIGTSVKGYAPDGNYPEGYNYWGYGTTFNVLMIAALESALETDAGLCNYPGFMESAEYMLYMAGTTGLAFNYSDARETKQSFPAQFWFAQHQHDTSLLWNELEFLRDENSSFTAEEERFLPLTLIYGSKIDLNSITPPQKKIWYGHGKTPVVLVRTDWKPGKGCYLGIKGGRAEDSHAHMDAGSFVFEASGVRWAQDMGMQEYETLEQKGVDLWNSKQDGQRWDVFRYNNFAHNTLTVNGQKHIADAFVPINKVIDTKSQLGAELDLTPLFSADIKKAKRKIILTDESYLTITDEIRTGGQEADICWTMFTTATPKKVDDRSIVLNKNGKQLRMIIESPYEASFKIRDNAPAHEYDAPNPNSCRVTACVKVKANSRVNIKIKLVPVNN